MIIDNYRHIHIYENCSANNAFSQFFDRRDVTHFLGDYKGAGAVNIPANNQKYNRIKINNLLKQYKDD